MMFAHDLRPTLVARVAAPLMITAVTFTSVTAQLAIDPLHARLHGRTALVVWLGLGAAGAAFGFRFRRPSLLYAAAIPYAFALWMAAAALRPHGRYDTMAQAFVLSLGLAAAIAGGLLIGRRYR